MLLLLTLAACGNEKQNQESSQKEITTTGKDITDIVPEGGIYYHKNSWSFAQTIQEFNLGTKLEAGQKLPETLTGDILVYENTIYVYNAHLTSPISGFIGDDTLNGWGAAYGLDVASKDINILNSINEHPVVSVAHFFRGQKISKDLKKITIPKNVVNITGMFDSSLQEGPITLSLESTPIEFANCLRFAGTPIVENGKVTFTNENEIYIEGSCDNETKMKIAEEKTQGITTYIK